jgi:predicted amidohydrolase
MAARLKAGAAQFASAIGDLEANFARHEAWFAQARAEGVELLVCPELSLAGHYGAERLLDVAIKRSDPRMKALADAAGPMAAVVGFVEEGPGAQFYNAAAVLHQGRIVYIHRKINLPSYGRLIETKYYAQGRFVDTHPLGEDWLMGLLICADLYNPALTHLSFLHGATLLAVPISSGAEAVGEMFDNPRSWRITTEFYAMMYGAPVIMANRTGTEADLTFWGGSRIVDAFGIVQAEAGTDEALVTAEIDYRQVREARALLPTVRDSNIGLVQRETQRLIDRLGVPDIVRHD